MLRREIGRSRTIFSGLNRWPAIVCIPHITISSTLSRLTLSSRPVPYFARFSTGWIHDGVLLSVGRAPVPVCYNAAPPITPGNHPAPSGRTRGAPDKIERGHCNSSRGRSPSAATPATNDCDFQVSDSNLLLRCRSLKAADERCRLATAARPKDSMRVDGDSELIRLRLLSFQKETTDA